MPRMIRDGLGNPGIMARTRSAPPVIESTFGVDKTCPITSALRFSLEALLVTMMPVAVEIMSAGS